MGGLCPELQGELPTSTVEQAENIFVWVRYFVGDSETQLKKIFYCDFPSSPVKLRLHTFNTEGSGLIPSRELHSDITVGNSQKEKGKPKKFIFLGNGRP